MRKLLVLVIKQSNPSNSSQVICLTLKKVNLFNTRGKVRISPELTGFILWQPRISEQHFMAFRVELFQ